jgi:hypothetical protein
VSLRLPEPGSFEDLLRPIRIEVASLVRLSRHLATEPHWSAGVYRFDDPDSGGASAFGTCYTASTIEVAFAESVIHECGRFVRGSYEVPAAELTERSVVRFSCERRKTLVLADLTGAALKSLGLNNDISASADHAASQAWARATIAGKVTDSRSRSRAQIASLATLGRPLRRQERIRQAVLCPGARC